MNPRIPRPRRGTAVLGALVLSAVAFTAACSHQAPHAQGAIAVVIGDRANMPEPQLSTQDQTMLDDALLSNDMMYVVSVSGDPQTVYQKHLKTACDGDAACTGATDSFNSGVLPTLVPYAKARAAEADTLDAILLAAQDLDESGVSGPKQIIVIDSGLQTIGDITLQSPGAFSVTASSLVAQLKATPDRLSQLKGISVLWQGLGTVFTPQHQIPVDDVTSMQAMWKAVLGAGGATLKTEPSDDPNTAPISGLPAVTSVSFAPPPNSTPGCYRLREDQIGFLPGEAVLRDPAKAQQVLRPIAATLKSENIDATVIGTAALPGDEWLALSKQRAQVAVQLLESYGVSADNLTPVGVGVKFAGFVPDTDSSGLLIETKAVQNRLVIIQPVGTTCN